MNPATADFIGFLDNLQARNLEAIERDVEVPLSEMLTRVSMLRRHLPSGVPDGTTAALEETESALRGHIGTVIDRLAGAGEKMLKLIIQSPVLLRSDSDFYSQVKGFIRAFLDAAENSHNDRIIEIATNLAKTFSETKIP